LIKQKRAYFELEGLVWDSKAVARMSNSALASRGGILMDRNLLSGYRIIAEQKFGALERCSIEQNARHAV